jgi:hypothetical protein
VWLVEAVAFAGRKGNRTGQTKRQGGTGLGRLGLGTEEAHTFDWV